MCVCVWCVTVYYKLYKRRHVPSASNLGNVSVSSPVVAAAAITDEAESSLSLCESSIAFSGGEASRT